MNDYDHGGGVPGNPALHSSSDISPGRDTRSSVQASVRRPVPASSPPVGVLKASGFLGSFPSHALNPRACVSPVSHRRRRRGVRFRSGTSKPFRSPIPTTLSRSLACGREGVTHHSPSLATLSCCPCFVSYVSPRFNRSWHVGAS